MMKKRRMKKLNNKGYSLVEMIIVIAIIAILTTAAFVTLAIIGTAKAKEASITFESEVASILSKTKGKACDADMDGTISDAELKSNSYGLRIHRSGGKIYLQTVVMENGIYKAYADFEEKNNPNNGLGVSLSSKVQIMYTPIGGTEYEITGSAASVIAYDKSGRCFSGAGTYKFYRNNGDKIATVIINKNGSRKSE